MKHGLFLFLVLLTAPTIRAEAYFAFTDNAKKAYVQATSLRFDAANSTLARIKIHDPDNLIVYHIENYIDFFTILINEDKAEFKRLEKNKNYRLSKIRKGSESSPYYLYTQAEILLQWATVRLKFEEYFEAFNEVSKAYKLLEQNKELFPDFVANNKSIGILHAIVGTIPDSYKWGVRILSGMEGTIEQGRQEIEAVIRHARHHNFIYEEETLVLYAFLLLHLKNSDEEAWQILQSERLDPENNPMACFVKANVAMRTGRNTEAIQLLENRPDGNGYHHFHYLDFMLGEAKLQRLDADAEKYFLRFLKNFHGQNYIKEAYQKLAWSRLIHNDRKGYDQYIQQCVRLGFRQIEGDKNAEREAETGEVPDPVILRGRLLFDGGYYHRAHQLMIKHSASAFYQKKHQLEYNYRLGRILHQIKNLPDAIDYYLRTIEQGRDEPQYYACNAALQLGIIHEQQRRYQKAREYFDLCLDLKPEQYRNGLHQKAKAGLNRLKSLSN